MVYNQPHTVYYKAAAKVERFIEPVIQEIRELTKDLDLDPETGMLSLNLAQLEKMFDRI